MKLGPVILDVQGTQLTKEEEHVLQHPQVGGVILFSRNYQNPQQVTELIQSIKSLRSNPLWIAVDQEGGRVQRFKEGVTRLPPLKTLGTLYDNNKEQALRLAHCHAWVMASEMLSLGVDHSFAPVLDVDSGISAVIGDRSFHHDPLKVYQLANAYIQGMREAGMVACGKHFPGHGSVAADSHVALPVDEREIDVISHHDMQPFTHLIKDNLLQAIMPAHIIFKACDPNPVGFSAYWLKDILQKQLGFKGVIISDDLSMEGAANVGDYPARARFALNAGCHALLVCNHPKEAKVVIESLEREKFSSNGELETLYGQSAYASLEDLKQSSLYRERVDALATLYSL